MNDRKCRLKTVLVSAIIAIAFSVMSPASILAEEMMNTGETMDMEIKVERIKSLMADKVPMDDRNLRLEVTNIPNPVDRQFDLFNVEYKGPSGKSLGAITVAAIEVEGKYFMLQGGSVVDTEQGEDLQLLWRSLTEKVELPHKPEQLIIGRPEDCRMKVTVFSDFQCAYCKTFVPQLLEKVENDPELCLYYVDFPLETLHKRAKYISKMAYAFFTLTGGHVPSDIYEQDFGENDSKINQYFERMIENRGMDVTAFYKKVSSPEVTEKIDADMELAKTLKVRGTPSVYIEGHPVQPTMEMFEKIKTLLDARQNS